MKNRRRALHLITYTIRFLQVRRGKPHHVTRRVIDVGNGVDVARISTKVAKILRAAGVRWL